MFGFSERHHSDRTAPQVRVDLLLDRGEKAVKVDIKPFDSSRTPHRPLPKVGSDENI
jgi:hypothetical protein